jgi:HEPN domain-containing protein/predicted nucleotidyltransferase
MRTAPHVPIDEALVERMRDRLIEACDPQYLYLFGSVARGEETPESDVDLLVVTTPSAGTTVSETAAQLRSLIREDGLSIDLIVQTPEQFRRQLRLPGFIARTARQDGRLLHSTEPLPPMPDPEYHDAAHEWYEQGDRDRRMARLLLSADPPELGGVAFHSQQAVEKYFKAILTLHREEPPYTHDLGELLDQIEQYEEEFGAFRSAAEKMSPFAVAVRYPNPENVPTEEEARGLVERVDTIRSEVRDRLFPKE